MGELVHCIVLEPDEVKNRYHIAPNVSGATSEERAGEKTAIDFLGNALDKGITREKKETAIEAKISA